MPLDPTKLQNLTELPGGIAQAQCPACAESGQDKAGNHLRIYPDGRFGCCVFPKDRLHRKRIFALAGNHVPRKMEVKVKTAVPSVPIKTIKRKADSGTAGTAGTANGHYRNVGTAGTGCESRSEPNLGRTGHLSIHTSVHRGIEIDSTKLCDFWDVPRVPVAEPPIPTPKSAALPFITPNGDLVIPFAAPPRYHWWNGGQSVSTTKAELSRQV